MKTKAPWGLFWLRLALAGLFARIAASGITGIFSSLAKTEDWVLEYRYWITAGTYLITVGMWVGIMFLTRSPQAESDKQEADRQDGTQL